MTATLPKGLKPGLLLPPNRPATNNQGPATPLLNSLLRHHHTPNYPYQKHHPSDLTREPVAPPPIDRTLTRDHQHTTQQRQSRKQVEEECSGNLLHLRAPPPARSRSERRYPWAAITSIPSS